MIGMESVKRQAYTLAAQAQSDRERAEAGLPPENQTNHLVFTGNPGTGKTTTARIFKDLYYGLGLIDKDRYVEAQTDDLVAPYMGQTPERTRKFLEANKGGVIFIDEAYKLSQGDNEYGRQALDEILTFADEHRGDTVMILAGYPNQVQQMLGSNPGLQRRFPNVIELPDLTRADMGKVMHQQLQANLDKLGPGGHKALESALDRALPALQTGNGGEVRNLKERIWAARAVRIAGLPEPRSVADKTTITVEDIENGLNEYLSAAKAKRGKLLPTTPQRRRRVSS